MSLASFLQDNGATWKNIFLNSINSATAIIANLIPVGTPSSATGSMSGSRAGVTRTLWGRFNPTSGTSVTLVNGSYGFASAVYNSTGQFTLNFVTPFTYPPSVQVTIVRSSTVFTDTAVPYITSITTSSCQVLLIQPSVAWKNLEFFCTVTGI